ncbi:MAG: hypothetical protein ACOYMA_22390, partial [Bacteroidia bacterium]
LGKKSIFGKPYFLSEPYLDTLFANSLTLDTFYSKIPFENYRKMKINDLKTYSLISTIIFNKYLHDFDLGCLLDFSIDESNMRIVPTKDNYKIGDNLQVYFSEDYYKERLAWNFTRFTRNGIPLNIKDLNYDKERRMIDFKIKEKGLYKIKGYEVLTRNFDYKNFSDTVPFETEYEVK